MQDADRARRHQDESEPPLFQRGPCGRIHLCPELRRVVIDFRETYLVLRWEEFARLRDYFTRLNRCGAFRSRMARGERIRLRDAFGEGTLVLGLSEVGELAELMETAGRMLPTGSEGGG